MTQEEAEKLDDLCRKTNEIHRWLFSGEPTRAKRLDAILGAVSAGKLGGRVVMYAAAAVVAVAAAWGEVKGWFWR